MALQTSGAISLNDIHVEAGGGSGTQASINDADIRDLIGKGSGAQASFSEYYGASSFAGFYSFLPSLYQNRIHLRLTVNSKGFQAYTIGLYTSNTSLGTSFVPSSGVPIGPALANFTGWPATDHMNVNLVYHEQSRTAGARPAPPDIEKIEVWVGDGWGLSKSQCTLYSHPGNWQFDFPNGRGYGTANSPNDLNNTFSNIVDEHFKTRSTFVEGTYPMTLFYEVYPLT